MKYVVFSKASCPYCQKAEKILLENGLAHHIINFKDSQKTILQEISKAYDWPTVPMIFEVSKCAKINFIGGCSDLEEHLGV